MEFIDIILLVIIGGFALAGLWFGFIHTLGSLIGTIIGAYVASRYYDVLADWVLAIFSWEGNAPRVFMFVVAFFVINRIVGLGFWFVEKMIGFLTRLPFVRSLNRFLGLLLGAAEGIISVGLVIFFIERFPLSDFIMDKLANSVVAPYTSDIASILWPLLPEAMQLLKSTVDYVENVVL